MKIVIPERFIFLYHLLIKLLPFGLGMFCFGAAVTSILTKRGLVPLTAFLSPELITEAHQKWVCLTIPSYTSDIILLIIAKLLIGVFVLEVKPNE